MALFIKNPTVERSARKLARLTGETLTEATLRAIQERLTRIQPERSSRRVSSQLEKDYCVLGIGAQHCLIWIRGPRMKF